MEERRLDQVIREYEQAVAADVEAMARARDWNASEPAYRLTVTETAAVMGRLKESVWSSAGRRRIQSRAAGIIWGAGL